MSFSCNAAGGPQSSACSSSQTCPCLVPLLQGYIDNRRKDVEVLSLDLKNGNMRAISQRAMDIGLTSPAFGLSGLTEVAQELYKASEQNNWSDTARLLMKLKTLLNHL